MAKKVLTRTIRPSSRKKSSKSYKVDVSRVASEDILAIEIDHETEDLFQTVWFEGSSLRGKKSVHFHVDDKQLQRISWTPIPPKIIPTPIEIVLRREWFEMGYYVYVVVIRDKDKRYFYVGMTGDRNYTTARSPFYRMSGHFAQSSTSTQNQILESLKVIFPIDGVDFALQNVDIVYYAYQMAVWNKHDSKLRHNQKRRFSEKIESCLINLLKKEFPNRVVNKRVSTRACDDVLDIAIELKNDVLSRLRKQ